MIKSTGLDKKKFLFYFIEYMDIIFCFMGLDKE